MYNDEIFALHPFLITKAHKFINTSHSAHGKSPASKNKPSRGPPAAPVKLNEALNKLYAINWPPLAFVCSGKKVMGDNYCVKMMCKTRFFL